MKDVYKVKVWEYMGMVDCITVMGGRKIMAVEGGLVGPVQYSTCSP